MDEYISNSDKSRNGTGKSDPIPEKRVESVVSGSTVTQKKSGLGKFKDSIIAEDARSVGSWLLSEVVYKSIKKFVYDMVTNGIDMLLYGETSHAKANNNGLSKISYGSYYSGYKSSNDSLKTTTANASVFDYDNIIFSNRGDAEAVLSTMLEILDQFGVVSVGDLYDLANVNTQNYTVNKFGWTNLRNAQVMRCRDGYILKLPKATAI